MPETTINCLLGFSNCHKLNCSNPYDQYDLDPKNLTTTISAVLHVLDI